MKVRHIKRRLFERLRFSVRNQDVWFKKKQAMPGVGHFWSGRSWRFGINSFNP